jgi:CheY-like chemotaxis protein
VEDEEAVRGLVTKTLKDQGYRLLVAASGIEGLESAERHEGRIDLLISDVVMPQMGGKELADQLRLKRPGIHVLYISGYTESTVLRTGALQKDEIFLQKPFTPMTLTRRVRELLDTADGEPGSSKAGSSKS